MAPSPWVSSSWPSIFSSKKLRLAASRNAISSIIPFITSPLSPPNLLRALNLSPMPAGDGRTVALQFRTVMSDTLGCRASSQNPPDPLSLLRVPRVFPRRTHPFPLLFPSPPSFHLNARPYTEHGACQRSVFPFLFPHFPNACECSSLMDVMEDTVALYFLCIA